jgi:hypothetical protein
MCSLPTIPGRINRPGRAPTARRGQSGTEYVAAQRNRDSALHAGGARHFVLEDAKEEKR